MQPFPQTQEVPGHVAHNEADIRELPESWMVLPAGAQFMTKNTKFNPAVTRTCVLCKMTLKKVGVGQECLSPVSECLGGSSTPPHAVSSLLPCAPGGSRWWLTSLGPCYTWGPHWVPGLGPCYTWDPHWVPDSLLQLIFLSNKIKGTEFKYTQHLFRLHLDLIFLIEYQNYTGPKKNNLGILIELKTCFLSCLISQSHRIFVGLFLWLRDREIITPAGSSPNSCNIWGCARLMPEQSSSLTCIAETSHLNHQLLPPKVSVSRNLEAAVRAGESKPSILFWNTDILISYLLGQMLVSFVNSERNIFKSRICCSEMLINIEVFLSERRICLFLYNGKVDLVCWLSLSPSASKSIPAVRMIVL